MADRELDKINELKRIMNTVDGRDFLFQFISDSCGVDFSAGIPSAHIDDYKQGLYKPAIDLFNLMIYNCYDNFIKMISEQKLREQNKEKEHD